MWVSTSFKKPFLLSLAIWFMISSLTYFFHPLQPFQSIAHRGASLYAPENTIASFQKAIDLGFDYIELDVRVSKDGHLVVIHDADVRRTTNGEGYIGDLTIQEIKMLDAGSWFSPEFSNEKVPLLEEILLQFGGKIGLLIEMKSPENQPEMTELLSSILKSYIEIGLKPSSLKVQSFNTNEMEKFHTITPNISTGLLLNEPLDLFHLDSYRSFASFLSIHHQLLTQPFIRYAKKYGFEIFSWTIKDAYVLQAMQRLGVHGIISDEDFRSTDTALYTFIPPFIYR
ncbi:glycerophosphodiester phosphodiesterase [Cytobacillus sp. FJAT-53684]|uniref:Glycerophosphodiester phosphodiesterase n=1 Tax=Cytobacillus mangrovibacter TaxID=3299024 RepID=A0ABW6JYH6_9BACI